MSLSIVFFYQCLFILGVATHVVVRGQRWGWFLSFYHVSPRNWTWVIRLGDKRPCRSNHMLAPRETLLQLKWKAFLSKFSATSTHSTWASVNLEMFEVFVGSSYSKTHLEPISPSTECPLHSDHVTPTSGSESLFQWISEFHSRFAFDGNSFLSALSGVFQKFTQGVSSLIFNYNY